MGAGEERSWSGPQKTRCCPQSGSSHLDQLKESSQSVLVFFLATTINMANLPNLRRLFVEARSEAEENEYSRTAFYNLVLFISSVAVFSLAAQRMSGSKSGK
ncbi:hypothetical protein P175DRAFT_0535817 [Aspergillus ochraceoroseus IBT 24754]|uniref:Uncharacterized protein n=1 Tax=Aspergillus ochraceoroseus IBT 24754 TaxID=1392256 RepID=A0A2T5LMI8_9EURO|nr:uncharacterized protein P175DRAFT_0535817 [Aspergillus ochraceoroseus IBT 24754]PTU17487.1 hypothetical protein P175DRAFT_0535817 [Aspergillus ochraceoroseus IBT 24754]